ncbi:MAG TPA: hypothetical protein VHW72_06180 [Candidatus Angelobacter sp.]|jgi:hypothetical protein|nr:hypothetical protein [Candidatus Angelobacter sp.]
MDGTSISQVFVLMPFDRKFDKLLDQIKLAAIAAGGKAERVTDQLYEEHIMERVLGQIETADAIVAVMTGKRANVFYEVGIAHSLQKHVVLLTDNPKDIPFDLKDCRHVVYGEPGMSSAKFVEELTIHLKWVLSNPKVSGSYYQEYKNALAEVESLACGLAPFFIPIASRCFNEWIDYVRALVTEGIAMRGPERLRITQLLVHKTKKYRLMEKFIGNPAAVHSRDWISFYDEIGRNNEIEKAWILCADQTDVLRRKDDVAATLQFLKERNFDTRHCPPEELERATGERAPRYQSIEDYGNYVKFLSLPAASYAAGDQPNVLVTTFKVADERHRRLISSIFRCSKQIDEKWLIELGGAVPVAGMPVV